LKPKEIQELLNKEPDRKNRLAFTPQIIELQKSSLVLYLYEIQFFPKYINCLNSDSLNNWPPEFAHVVADSLLSDVSRYK